MNADSQDVFSFRRKSRMRRPSIQTPTRSVSAPMPDVSHSEPWTLPDEFAFNFEIQPQPLQELEISKGLNQSLAELKEEIIAKSLPGQWFRKIEGQKTDITVLPPELHVEILKHVGFLEQIVCERVCTTWRTIIRRDCSFRYASIDDAPWTGIKDEKISRALVPHTGTSALNRRVRFERRPKILIHRLLQDGNFAFRQIPGAPGVEVMSISLPMYPGDRARQYKLANLTFLNDPIAVYDTTTFNRRTDVPTITIEFDSEPLRNEFHIRIGGNFNTANTAEVMRPTLPTPFPGHNWFGRLNSAQPHFYPRTLHAREAWACGETYSRSWDLGALLLGILGKLESPRHWYEDTALERNERWNGPHWGSKRHTGLDFDGDWDMDNGFRVPLTIQDIVMKEHQLLEQYRRNGYWYMRQWEKDTKYDEMHVGLTPVSDWIWEICY
ncbi:hypothetical protein TWF694_002100 [Orbilia ellipsospora]|uniref:F-box domain-containing protein n=1 Tax=Orbilia ellipsospora TaxID=2528407 RepID=A0AAV9XAQ9_9PEZI